MKFLKFYISLGIFGQYGWKKISFIKWLYYQFASNYVTKITLTEIKEVIK